MTANSGLSSYNWPAIVDGFVVPSAVFLTFLMAVMVFLCHKQCQEDDSSSRAIRVRTGTTTSDLCQQQQQQLNPPHFTVERGYNSSSSNRVSRSGSLDDLDGVGGSSSHQIVINLPPPPGDCVDSIATTTSTLNRGGTLVKSSLPSTVLPFGSFDLSWEASHGGGSAAGSCDAAAAATLVDLGTEEGSKGFDVTVLPIRVSSGSLMQQQQQQVRSGSSGQLMLQQTFQPC